MNLKTRELVEGKLRQLSYNLECQKRILESTPLISKLPDKGERVKQKIALLEKNISELEAIRDGSVVNEESLRKELAIGDNKEQAMKNNKEQTMEENRPQVKLNKKEQVMDEEEEEDVLDLASAIEKLSVVDEEERAALTTQRRRAALQNDPVQKRLQTELLHGTKGLEKYQPRKVIALSIEESLLLYKENISIEDDLTTNEKEDNFRIITCNENRDDEKISSQKEDGEVLD